MAQVAISKSITTKYFGQRDGCATVQVRDSAGTSRLPQRQDLMNHSPGGFEWGYGGSGPAQLALAILADYLGDSERALSLYQDFKWLIVATLPHEKWELTGAEIDAAIYKITAARERSA